MSNPVISIHIPRASLQAETSDDLFNIQHQLGELLTHFAECVGIPNYLLTYEIEFVLDSPLAVSIHNTVLPANIYLDDTPKKDDISLVHGIYNAIIANRTYIINNEIANEVVRAFVKKTSIPIEVSMEFFRSFLHHGINFDRPLKDFVQLHELRADRSWIEYQIEILVSSYSKERMLFRTPANCTTIDDFQVENFKESVFFDSGFTIKGVDLVVDESISKGLITTLNDINLNYCRSLDEAKNNVMNNLGAYFHLNSMDEVLGRLDEAFPMVVFNATETIGSEQLVKILRRLLQERLSIRDLRGIIGDLLEVNMKVEYSEEEELIVPYGISEMVVSKANRKPTIIDLVNHVKYKLNYYFIEPYLINQSIKLVKLSPSVEKYIAEVSLKHLEKARLLESFHQAYQNFATSISTKGVLTTIGAQKTLIELLQADLPGIRVFSERDIPDNVKINVVGIIDELDY